MRRPSSRRPSRWQRRAAWARAVACCPSCQVLPGTPCRQGSSPLAHGAVHARRYQEAEATAA
ncbi:hypothetical protein ACIRF8_15185 [Streptomyces sp. NPDC102406]|uniref:zinc finger domain-containing protein n=1 Tax=Streptomyces sp. NPDC102406 TaxID=3366171 RepID=UPI0037F3F9AF